MKNLVLVTLACLALVLPVVESFFLGPLAIGAAVGALALKKGLILGGLLSRRRSRRTDYGRSYSRPTYKPYRTTKKPYRPTRKPYRPTHTHTEENHYSYSEPAQPYKKENHYSYSQPAQPYKKENHYSSGSYYAKPSNTYYYSSQRYNRRGKRFAGEEMPSHEEVARFRREVETNGLNDNTWWLEMLEKDQDDCTKRLICEISAKSTMESEVEVGLMKIFGEGRTVDVSKATALFDLAAQAGKNSGVKTCQAFYKRCDTPVDIMISMIEEELKDFEILEKEFEDSAGGDIKKGETFVEDRMAEEKEDLAKEMIAEGVIEDSNQIWG